MQLKDALDQFYEIAEEHAAKKGTGLAKIISNEISGFGGWKFFDRINSQCLQQLPPVERPAPPARPSGGAGGQRSNRGSRNKTPVGNSRDVQKIKCYNCNKYGHIRPNCPDLVNKSA